jgi:predicted nucleic acid-binding protein
MQTYLLDACALIAYFSGEDGALVIKDLLDRADRGEITLSINAANLIEIYYDRIRVVGPDKADAVIRDIYDIFPITIIEANNIAIVREAAYFKVTGKMSFADSILVSTALCIGATVVTCDHDELEPIEQRGTIPFLWIRP